MRIEVVAIGDEILRGASINTNAAFISHQLFQHGFSTFRHTAIADNPLFLEAGLKEALSRSDIVITTGGLGPTCDDHTRPIAARLFGSDFHYDETIANDLRNRFGEGLTSLKDQATVPSKALVLRNRVGTAPGLLFSNGHQLLALMPGVAEEMQQIVTDELIPYLLKRFPESHKKACIQIFFCHLFESMVDPTLRKLCEKYPAVEAGIYPAAGYLTVALQSVQEDQVAAFRSELTQIFGEYEFTAPNGKLEEAVHGWFIKEKKTLALAESCTGGQIAAQLIRVAGASAYFLGSFVVYSNEMKQNILGVSEKTLKTAGAVSRETAAEMLEGVFTRTTADYGIAVTGIAGPDGGSESKPVGTIWAAIGERGKEPDIGMFLVKGNRQSRILKASNHLLGALWRKVTLGIPVFPFYK